METLRGCEYTTARGAHYWAGGRTRTIFCEYALFAFPTTEAPSTDSPLEALRKEIVKQSSACIAEIGEADTIDSVSSVRAVCYHRGFACRGEAGGTGI